jgi:molybdopterin converting factor small subunit
VLEVSSVLIDGRTTSDPATALDATMSIEVLPPFAGG